MNIDDIEKSLFERALAGYLDLACRITIELDEGETLEKRLNSRSLQGMGKFCQTMRILAKKLNKSDNEYRVPILINHWGRC